MAQFTIYRSADASAPQLAGTAGSLLAVLDGCLVNGYGAKAAAGWTKPFVNAGNIGCYKNAGSGMCLSINDNGPGTGTFTEARMNGYESMTSVSAGSGPFPASTQGLTGFLVCRKSTAASAVTRAWLLVADAYTFYLWILTGDGTNKYFTYAFGDFFSLYGSGDAYRAFISGRPVENSASATSGGFGTLAAMTGATTYDYCPRSVGQQGFSINITRHGDASKGSTTAWQGNMACPNAADNSFYLSPIWVGEQSAAPCQLRGRLRGIYQILHSATNFVDGQTFAGSGDFAGKTFMIVSFDFASNSVQSIFTVEISNTLETN